MKYKLTLLLFFSCFIGFNCLAQQKFEDIIHLKDGGKVRGLITKRGPNEQIAIETVGKNVFVFQKDQISHVSREDLSSSERKERKSKSTKQAGTTSISFDSESRTGFMNITEAGVLLGNSVNGEEAHLSLQSVNGYKFNDYFSVGLGLGVDMFEDGNVFPVFLDVRGYLMGAKVVSPYVYGNVGYGFTSADKIQNYTDSQRGGIVYGAGVGMQVYKSSNLSWVWSVGYKQQSTFAEYTDINGGTHERTLNLQRLVIKTGIQF